MVFYVFFGDFLGFSRGFYGFSGFSRVVLSFLVLAMGFAFQNPKTKKIFLNLWCLFCFWICLLNVFEWKSGLGRCFFSHSSAFKG